MSFGRQIPPRVVFPSPNEWPETVFPIDLISPGSSTKITCSAYPFAQADVNVTTVIFKQVTGMRQINGLPGLITAVNGDQFTVNINSTNFYPYLGGGVMCIVTGQPPYETVSYQTFNTPFHNLY